MLFRSSRTDRNVFLEQQDKSKCCPGAAGYVEMSSWSSSTGRAGVLGQQDTSKCRPGAAGQVGTSKMLVFHWFYKFCDEICWFSIGVTSFLMINVRFSLVLQAFFEDKGCAAHLGW